MKKPKPIPSDEKHHILTEGIDYSKTSRGSIWGEEDLSTLNLVKDMVQPGSTWINLAAGDGRYNNLLVEKARNVTVVDIDEGALRKLEKNTPKKNRSKLNLEVFNIVKKFPLESEAYDGLFSAGTLYLFPIEVLKEIAQEISRVLKPGGVIALEWAIDVKRTSPNGEILHFGKEPLYDEELTEKSIRDAFSNFSLEFLPGEEVFSSETEANPPYEFYCKTLLIRGQK